MLNHGLIVGKFSPLHRGHEELIKNSQKHCLNLTILTYSNPEFPGCEAAKRNYWLEKTFPKSIVISISHDDPLLKIPENSEPDDIQRDFVLKWCKKNKYSPDIVFTSENYGEGFADYLSKGLSKKVNHFLFDLHRTKFTISGTQIRSDIHSYKKYLSDIVYTDFVKTVCFLGAESTGKSTITKLASEKYNTINVNEYGRTLWEEKNGNLIFEDMLKIGQQHIENENSALPLATKYLFADTSPLTTSFYSSAMFNKVDPKLEELSWRKYDYYFLCLPDFPFVQDGTRQDEDFRKKQHEWYVCTLLERKIKYSILQGSIGDRIKHLGNILDG
jgi:NadR type nicotinamide-nucleotide adenylyltransferase